MNYVLLVFVKVCRGAQDHVYLQHNKHLAAANVQYIAAEGSGVNKTAGMQGGRTSVTLASWAKEASVCPSWTLMQALVPVVQGASQYVLVTNSLVCFFQGSTIQQQFWGQRLKNRPRNSEIGASVGTQL